MSQDARLQTLMCLIFVSSVKFCRDTAFKYSTMVMKCCTWNLESVAINLEDAESKLPYFIYECPWENRYKIVATSCSLNKTSLLHAIPSTSSWAPAISRCIHWCGTALSSRQKHESKMDCFASGRCRWRMCRVMTGAWRVAALRILPPLTLMSGIQHACHSCIKYC